MMMKVLMIGLAIVIAILIISIFTPILKSKSGGILSFLEASQNNRYEVTSAQNHVDKVYEDNVYSFLFVEGDYKKNIIEDFKSKGYQDFNKKFKSGCNIGTEFPNYLSADGCWIFSIERDPAFLNGDDCGNFLFIEKDDEPILSFYRSFANHNPFFVVGNLIASCVDMDKKDTCSDHSLYIIKAFLSNSHFVTTSNMHVSVGWQWLCGKQEPGPKVWFLCDEKLASKQTENLVLFIGLGEPSISYECECPDDFCEWKKVENFA